MSGLLKSSWARTVEHGLCDGASGAGACKSVAGAERGPHLISQAPLIWFSQICQVNLLGFILQRHLCLFRRCSDALLQPQSSASGGEVNVGIEDGSCCLSAASEANLGLRLCHTAES